MKIILSNPRGFCAGVRMAVEVVDQVIDLYPAQTIYVYHEIVHNRHVVARLRERGAVFIEDLNHAPPRSVVIFSAHGVSPAVRELARARNLTPLDATCPLVTKVHSEAIRYARQGYQILLVGHADHQEVIGTRGEAPDHIQVVEHPDDIPTLRITDPARLVYLTQTTLSLDDAGVIIDALKRAFPLIKEPPSSDICYATTNRQLAVRAIAPECDLVLVIGSTNSSNSVRLTEIALASGTPSHLIDDVSHLDPAWFPTGEETVLITAGASAPEHLVQELCRTLLARYAGTIEQRDLFNEDVTFALPAGLRKIMAQRGITATTVHVALPPITAQAYGAVPLTVSAKQP